MGLTDLIWGVSAKAVLGLALASGAGGCGAWQYDRTEFNTIGSPQNRKEVVGIKTKNSLEYNILREYKLENNLISVPVKESKNEQEYSITSSSEFITQEEVIVETRDIPALCVGILKSGFVKF